MDGSWARNLRENDKVKRVLDLAHGAGIALAVGLLFKIDISEPRGILDGIGYVAVIALTSPFGKRALLITATVISILIAVAAFQVPDRGISVMGMWANRAFAIFSVWTVVLVMCQRIELEDRIRRRETSIHRHQIALSAIVRHCLLTDIPLDERLAFICRIGAQALECGLAVITQRNDGDDTATILQSWRKPPQTNPLQPGTILQEDPCLKTRLQAELVVAIADIELSDAAQERRRLARDLGIRAMLASEIYHGAPRSGMLFFAKEDAYTWNEEETAFARAVSNLVALLLSAQATADTLAALEMTDDGIFTEDAEGNVEYANRAARLLARPGKTGLTYPRPRAPLRGQHDRSDIHLDGRELEVHRSRLPTGGLIARLADVTERNRAVTERAKLEDRLRQAAKMEAIGQLASGVAHDFNNVLGAITGFAGFIAEDQALDTTNRDFAQRILAASKRGKEMVEQIMTFGEDRGVTLETVNLGRTVGNSGALLADAMPPGARLDVICRDEEPLLVRGNAVQIGQLITNLVTNGRDALKNGEGWVRIEVMRAPPHEIEALRRRADNRDERRVGLLRPDCAYARLSVQDSGAGIPAEIMDRVFEPFFSTKNRQRGTGLGLAVVHGVIRAHVGFCHLRSTVGAGTQFDIYLPLLAEEAATSASSIRWAACRVLIVDDDEDMADMLSIGLERLGFQTVTVQDPLLALAAIREDPCAFDALLTDQIMPGMHGTELIREARLVAPGLRTIICTAYVEHAAEPGKLMFVADAVVHKPVEIQTVAEAIAATQPEE